MAELLTRALAGRRRALDTTSPARPLRPGGPQRERVNELVASIAARPGPYKAGRRRSEPA